MSNPYVVDYVGVCSHEDNLKDKLRQRLPAPDFWYMSQCLCEVLPRTWVGTHLAFDSLFKEVLRVPVLDYVDPTWSKVRKEYIE